MLSNTGPPNYMDRFGIRDILRIHCTLGYVKVRVRVRGKGFGLG